MAFRPRLLAGLALSLLTFKRGTNGQFSQSGNLFQQLLASQLCPLRVISGPFGEV